MIAYETQTIQSKCHVHIEYVADIYTYTIFVGTYQTHQSHIEL